MLEKRNSQGILQQTTESEISFSVVFHGFSNLYFNHEQGPAYLFIDILSNMLDIADYCDSKASENNCLGQYTSNCSSGTIKCRSYDGSEEGHENMYWIILNFKLNFRAHII